MEGSYIYQTIHTLSHHPLYVDAHCRILERAFMDVFFRPLVLDDQQITCDIIGFIKSKSLPTEVSVYIDIRVDIESRIEIELNEISIYDGYAMRCISPTASVVTFDSPFGLHMSSVRCDVLRFANGIANNFGGDIAVECDTRGVVCSAAGAAIFAVDGKRVIASTALESVERGLVIGVVQELGLELEERDIDKRELTTFDELFYCDHYGITSISRFERRTYMSIISNKIAREMVIPWR